MPLPDNDFLEEFSLGEPASMADIETASSKLGVQLPRDFCDFLLRHNGGEGFVGENYLIIWAAEELPEFNSEYQVSLYAPGLLLFGSSGGGEGYAFDTRDGSFSVVRVPFIGMDLAYATPVASTFLELFTVLAADDE